MRKSLWSGKVTGVGLRVCPLLKRRMSSALTVVSKGWYKLHVYILGTMCIDLDIGHIIDAQIFVEH